MNIYRLARLAKKITDDQESEHLIEYENQQFELIVPITPAGFRRLQKEIQKGAGTSSLKISISKSGHIYLDLMYHRNKKSDKIDHHLMYFFTFDANETDKIILDLERNIINYENCEDVVESITLHQQTKNNRDNSVQSQQRQSQNNGDNSVQQQYDSDDSVVTAILDENIGHNFNFNIDDGEEEQEEEDLKDIVGKLYRQLREAHFEYDNIQFHDVLIQHEDLKATLTPYQAEGVRWMLQRELIEDSYPEIYTRCHLKFPSKSILDRKCMYYASDYSELKIYDRPFGYRRFPIPSGGILADEMGLGKTVEFLALILLNRRHIPDVNEINVQMIVENENTDAIEVDTIDVQPPNKKLKMNEEINYNVMNQKAAHEMENSNDDDPEKPKEHIIELFCVCYNGTKTKLIKCTKCDLYQHRKCVLKHVIDFENIDATYICPACWKKEENIIAPTTLVVVPNAIKSQWMHEVKKHVESNIKVFIYNGYRASGWISPANLASYDIVVCDFQSLTAEFSFYEASLYERNLRNRSRYIRALSPLQRVHFWRIGVDEAQMIESGVSKFAKLIENLTSVHRWAITGTPIEKSLNDLRGLMMYLNCNPYQSPGYWRNDGLDDDFICGRNNKLIEILRRIMWRTCKTEDILNQVKIPNQTELVYYVKMSDLEAYFYAHEFRECYREMQYKIDNLRRRGEYKKYLSPHALAPFMEPLRKLRQDCSMPSIVTRTDSATKKSLSPDELHKHLKTNVETMAKSELRTIASSLNGLAALYIIQCKTDEAIKMYQKLLKWSDEYNDNICVDSLLQVHAFHNLLLIDTNLPNETKEKYSSEMIRLEKKYLEKNCTLVDKKMLERQKCVREVNMYRDNFNHDEHTWWTDIFAIEAKNSQKLIDLIEKITKEIGEKYDTNDLIGRNSDGISFVLSIWLDKLNDERKNVYLLFEKLNYFINNLKPLSLLDDETSDRIQKLIKTAFECHLDPQHLRNTTKQRKEIKCELCKAKNQLDTYECVIFDKKISFGENVEGTWQPSYQEAILKALFSATKRWQLDEETLEDGKTHLKLLEALRKEFKELSQLWVEVNYAVGVFDEIHMCKSRLQVYDPTIIEKEKIKSKLLISKYDVDDSIAENMHEMKHAEIEFVRKMGRLKYLNHLEKTNEVENCPICTQPPNTKYSVLECGHHLCMVCTLKWAQQRPGEMFSCPICRHKQPKNLIHFVHITIDERLTDSSSKIECVIQEVIKLKKSDPNIKIVIFSQYSSFLTNLEKWLNNNDIDCRNGELNIAQRINDFKDPTLNVTCLLLPLHAGSKGLNLTEAAHVFLIEPILNPGEEQQAVGRIHRMGQTKPTFVHRFVVKNTIEERIHIKLIDKNWSYKNWTLDNLIKLVEPNTNDNSIVQ